METWGLHKNQAWKYVHDAYVELSDFSDKTIEEAKNIQIERIEDLLKDALESNDKATAIKALDMINKIYSLYVEKQDVNMNINDIKFEFGEIQQ